VCSREREREEVGEGRNLQLCECVAGREREEEVGEGRRVWTTIIRAERMLLSTLQNSSRL